MLPLIIAMTLFVVTHFLMSHPLRAPMVGALGEKGFLGTYSLVSTALLVWAVLAYGDTAAAPLWAVPVWLLAAGHLTMLAASILFLGSFLAPNPALTGAGGLLSGIDQPRGVMRITRHPMMWGIGLWGLAHIALAAQPGTLVFAGGIALLALVGAAAQDGKKRALIGDAWTDYTAKTSYWPRPAWPGIVPLVGGGALYAAFVWLHPLVIGHSTRLWEVF